MGRSAICRLGRADHRHARARSRGRARIWRLFPHHPAARPGRHPSRQHGGAQLASLLCDRLLRNLPVAVHHARALKDLNRDHEDRGQPRIGKRPAMSIAALGGAMLGPLDRLAAALVDPARRERTAIELLVAYVAVWTLYGVLAKGSQDVHFDMGEAVVWSREPALGYSKHPPLSAWVVKAWFTIFPLADWAYYLLAMSLAGLALWVAWVLSARWLDGEKRVAGLALLTLVPFFNFHALKFNANTVLIPLWAATTLFFLRSYEEREPVAAALAGVAAAAAMLGKYWSIVLLAGLAIAALADGRRRGYFRSPAPWITIAGGAIVLGPHVLWLLSRGSSPLDYALDKHPAQNLLDAGIGSLKFLAGGAAYVAVPLVLLAAATRPDAAAIRDTLWPPARHPRSRALGVW